MNRVMSHVKWFVDESPDILSGMLSPIEFAVIFSVFCIGLAILFTLQHFLNTSGWSHRISNKFSHLKPFLPEIVRISTGVLLIVNGLSRYLFAPNISADSTVERIVLIALVIIGFMLVSGFFTRLAAFGLIVLYALSASFIPPVSLLEHVEYIGLGLFILFEGCGLHGIDHRFHIRILSRLRRYRRWAYPSLRVATGVGLIVLALSEKLLNVNLASEFLLTHQWNFFEPFGISDRIFIIFSGTIELLIGVSFVLNIAARLTAIMLFALFVTTAILLGPLEIIGHLFAVPVVAAILIYGNDNAILELENAAQR